MEGVDVLVEVEGEIKMIGNKRGRGDDGEITTRLEKRPSGVMMVNQVSGLQQEVEEQINNYDYSGDEMINGVKYEEEKDTTPTPTPTPTPGTGTGLFNQLITNSVNNPKSNLQTHDDDDESKKNEHVGGGEGGGVINNFISNIFTSNNGNNTKNGKEVVVVVGEDSVPDAAPAQVVDDGQNENDGVIDNIVAQLPRTLSEDAAPATDEASILIHSIIHD